MKVTFKKSFVKDLRKSRERALGMRVRELIESIERASSLQEIPNLRHLKGAMGYYRIRVGDYRIGLYVKGETVTLIRFLHRKDIYRHFP